MHFVCDCAEPLTVKKVLAIAGTGSLKSRPTKGRKVPMSGSAVFPSPKQSRPAFSKFLLL